jgi:pimeloyl-ACP methyl ester carboxylesterase
VSAESIRFVAEISELIRSTSGTVRPGREIVGNERLIEDLGLDGHSLDRLADRIRSRYGPASDGIVPFLSKQMPGLRIADLAEYLADVLQDGASSAKTRDAEPSLAAAMTGDQGLGARLEGRTPNRRDGGGPWTAPDRHQPQNDNAAVLSECAPGTKRVLLRLPGGAVEVFTAGDGPPLILMHPLNIGAGVFARQFADLADRYRVICMHHPGVGVTTWKEDLTLGGLAGLHRSVLAELSVEPPFHVLGACFGGTVAQQFALLHPAECASLVLVGCSCRPGARDGGQRSLPTIANEEFDLMCGAGDLEGPRDVLEDLLLRCESMNTWVGMAYLQVLASKPSLYARLPEIAAPTLVLRGRLDTVIGVKHAMLLYGAIPGAQFVEIATAAHFPYLTHPVEFGAHLVPFLDRAARS